ncbi:MAG: flagellar basal body P-ring formation chaperone FlgA [Pseudomonadota bacterium]|nr:flagellar basal body P-ring formation chaperone FlgA [Pseudomonadota bacterium]
MQPLTGLLLLVLGLIWNPAAAVASGLQQQIDDAISLYVEETRDDQYQSLQVEIQPIDPRLQLSTCAEPLQLERRPPNRSVGRLTFRVSCGAPDHWSIHVPVTVQAFDHVVVADRPIAKDTHLSERELRLELRDVSRLYAGYFTALEELDGFVTRRPVRADQVMSPALVDPAQMINRGERVVIVAERPGLSIRTTGEAMEDGAFGELIRVRNPSSNKVVEGRITAPGQIKVSL